MLLELALHPVVKYVIQREVKCQVERRQWVHNVTPTGPLVIIKLFPPAGACWA